MKDYIKAPLDNKNVMNLIRGIFDFSECVGTRSANRKYVGFIAHIPCVASVVDNTIEWLIDDGDYKELVIRLTDDKTLNDYSNETFCVYNEVDGKLIQSFYYKESVMDTFNDLEDELKNLLGLISDNLKDMRDLCGQDFIDNDEFVKDVETFVKSLY